MLWAGGIMTPVAKKPLLPMSLTNSSGELCAPVPAKTYSKVLRTAALPTLQQVVGAAQFGAVPGGGTDLASAAVRASIERGRESCTSVAILFVDFAPPSTRS